MVVKVPMLAFVITVDQVSTYAVALFCRAMPLLHVMVLVSEQVTISLHSDAGLLKSVQHAPQCLPQTGTLAIQ